LETLSNSGGTDVWVSISTGGSFRCSFTERAGEGCLENGGSSLQAFTVETYGACLEIDGTIAYGRSIATA
jgi:hypothetical protein